jgi:hypothetical protein
MDPAPPELRSLVGVYHAEGTLRGEIAYTVGKLLGRAHCALCDITHGAVRRKREFDACAAGLPVPFDLVHLDERDADVAAASGGDTPCVLARTDDGVVRLVEPDVLESCAGDPVALVAAIEAAVAGRGLAWPGAGRPAG